MRTVDPSPTGRFGRGEKPEGCFAFDLGETM